MTQPPLPALVSDIGGTNTRVALADGPAIRIDTIRRYSNADYPGIEPILRAYLADAGVAACSGACVAAAGPVRDGVAELTNLAWVMSLASIGEATGASKVALLNDLQAPGYALATLPASSLRAIVPGPDAGPKATRLVVNVGTGFNAAVVLTGPGGRVVPASESGHVSLPVRSPDDLSLMAHIEAAHGFPSVEDVLSGRGLALVDQWARGGADLRDTAAVMADILAGTDPAAAKVAAIYIRTMGVVAGNLALTHLPFGGVYLTGGVARHFAPLLPGSGFAAAFCEKGRFAEFMQAFAVWAIEDDYAPLHGCAAHLAEVMAA